MEGKIKLPIVKNGYDVEATDTYLNMLQAEYNRVCEWGANLENRINILNSEKVDESQLESLKLQNRSLYNNCVAFAKHIKRLEKLKNEQGTFVSDELAETENKKRVLEQEIVVLEERKNFLKISNESVKEQSETIVRAANSQAEKILEDARAQAANIVEEAKAKANDLIKARMDKISDVFSQLDEFVSKDN